VHRDIKLENILISSVEDRSEYDIRIADFGLALFTPNDELIQGKCGSPGYVAPEVFKGHMYSYKVDVFSLGSIFYQLLTGQYLFDGNSAKEIIKRYVQCNLSHTYRTTKHISTQCRDLMMWMLESGPDDRPTAKQALRHHWFKCDRHVIRDLLIYNQVMVSGQIDHSSQQDKALSDIKSGISSNQGPNVSQIMNSFVMGNNFVSPQPLKKDLQQN